MAEERPQGAREEPSQGAGLGAPTPAPPPPEASSGPAAYCRACGNPLDPRANACPSCGAVQAAQAMPPVAPGRAGEDRSRPFVIWGWLLATVGAFILPPLAIGAFVCAGYAMVRSDGGKVFHGIAMIVVALLVALFAVGFWIGFFQGLSEAT